MTGRIKPKYNPTPTAAEKRFHEWLIENFICFCGCERHATVVHHPLTRHPEQRWRRDHEYVVPMFWMCHVALHRHGNERTWNPDLRFDEGAAEYREMGVRQGLLDRRAA